MNFSNKVFPESFALILVPFCRTPDIRFRLASDQDFVSHSSRRRSSFAFVQGSRSSDFAPRRLVVHPTPGVDTPSTACVLLLLRSRPRIPAPDVFCYRKTT